MEKLLILSDEIKTFSSGIQSQSDCIDDCGKLYDLYECQNYRLIIAFKKFPKNQNFWKENLPFQFLNDISLTFH